MIARALLVSTTWLLLLAGGHTSAEQDGTAAQPAADQKAGRIEGRVMAIPSVEHLSKVSVHSIELFVRDSGRPFSKAEVDSGGHFVFEDVPSGRVRLQPVFRVGESDRDVSLLSALLVPAILRSDTKLEIALFGKGRPIVGKIVLPAGIKPDRVRVWLRLLEPPTRTFRGPTLDVYSVLTANALESPLDAEGRFQFEGVREGNYRIGVKILDDGSKSLVFNGVTGRGYPLVEYGKLTVPFMAGGESDQPHDLGSLKFDLPPRSQQ